VIDDRTTTSVLALRLVRLWGGGMKRYNFAHDLN
jgi:hypothetical protein